MRRREFIMLVGGATAWPLTARAQQSKTPRVGALVLKDEDAQAFANEFREGLRELGYIGTKLHARTSLG
jgi:putative ABC transport system substrate-binding protein